MKLSGVQVTGSKDRTFQRTRLRLTVFYVALISLILIAFSLALYYSYARTISSDIEGNFTDQEQELIVSKSLTRLGILLVLINSGTLIATGIVSFVLVGETLKPIREAMDRQKQFTADAAHELRTPLTIMRTELEVALGDPELKKASPLLQSNLEEIERLSGLVENLLLISRMDDPQNRIALEKVDFSQLVRESLERMKPYMERKRLQLCASVPEGVVLQGDREWLRRLLFNLLKNAVDYNREEGEISVEIKDQDKGVWLAVRDTGIGIAPEDLPHVFERFYRADKSRSRKIQGTGLGLTIAKSIVEAHRGSIRLKSALGKGTTVEVFLPRS
ncbi:MAG: sensor histidine kinase [bacterium]